MPHAHHAGRILVADDEEDIRVLLKELLEHAGYAVEVACDGQETLDQLDAKRPDLLLLDLLMPRVDGWAVINRLAQRDDAPPIIILTGAVSFDHAGPAPAGVTATLAKPFSFTALLGLCASALGPPGH
jgi:two-component system alkaline phosphatase synthesis response regulator PhoP